MENIVFEIKKKEELLDHLVNKIRQEFKLYFKYKENLFVFLNSLKDDIIFLIEYPYVDKLYRDSFYNYYSTKYNNYERNSLRVSMFEPTFDFNLFTKKEERDKLKKKFLGFFTIRPVAPQILGRSLISPRALKNNNIECCFAKFNTSIKGIKFEIEAFPYTTQNSETISCAEVALWVTMEYFGSKYPEYKTVLPSTILKTLEDTTYQRQTPSNGLTSQQISRALKKYGLSSRLYTTDAYTKKNELKTMLDHYLLSGIPVIATIHNRKKTFKHAIVVIGHSVINKEKFRWHRKHQKIIKTKNGKTKLIDYSLLINEYIVMDDNKSPYEKITFNNPTPNYNEKRAKNTAFFSIIVPLYQKVYLETAKAEKLFISLLRFFDFGINNLNIIYKLFYTSSRSFKEGININNLDDFTKEFIILTAMPRFVWVIELIDQKNIAKDKAIGLIVIDATEANESDALILAVTPNGIITYDIHKPIKNRYKKIKRNINSFNIFANNLKTI